MAEYNVKYTDSSKPSIEIEESGINDGSVNNTDNLDIALFGRIRLEYGQRLNENLLNILENFACPEDPLTTDIYPANPDLTVSTNNLLEHPTDGQFWYNSTNQHFYVWVINEWVPLTKRGDYAANWGQISHGQQLPRPVSAYSGYIFDYDECIWNVSPAYITGAIRGMICTTDNDATVTAQYLHKSSTVPTDGVANYLIVGIRGDRKTVDFGDNPSAYFLTVSVGEIFEGQSFVVTLTTLNVPAGTNVPFTITGVTSSDFGISPASSGGLLTGNFVVDINGTSSITFLTDIDFITEGDETFILSLDNGKADSISVIIKDTLPTYSLSGNKASINEGDDFIITLTTTNVSPGTLVPYTITGVSSTDINGASLTGNFVVDDDGVTNIIFQTIDDGMTEGNETFALTLNGKNISVSTIIQDSGAPIAGGKYQGFLFATANNGDIQVWDTGEDDGRLVYTWKYRTDSIGNDLSTWTSNADPTATGDQTALAVFSDMKYVFTLHNQHVRVFKWNSINDEYDFNNVSYQNPQPMQYMSPSSDGAREPLYLYPIHHINSLPPSSIDHEGIASSPLNPTVFDSNPKSSTIVAYEFGDKYVVIVASTATFVFDGDDNIYSPYVQTFIYDKLNNNLSSVNNVSNLGFWDQYTDLPNSYQIRSNSCSTINSFRRVGDTVRFALDGVSGLHTFSVNSLGIVTSLERIRHTSDLTPGDVASVFFIDDSRIGIFENDSVSDNNVFKIFNFSGEDQSGSDGETYLDYGFVSAATTNYVFWENSQLPSGLSALHVQSKTDSVINTINRDNRISYSNLYYAKPASPGSDFSDLIYGQGAGIGDVGNGLGSGSNKISLVAYKDDNFVDVNTINNTQNQMQANVKDYHLIEKNILRRVVPAPDLNHNGDRHGNEYNIQLTDNGLSTMFELSVRAINGINAVPGVGISWSIDGNITGLATEGVLENSPAFTIIGQVTGPDGVLTGIFYTNDTNSAAPAIASSPLIITAARKDYPGCSVKFYISLKPETGGGGGTGCPEVTEQGGVVASFVPSTVSLLPGESETVDMFISCADGIISVTDLIEPGVTTFSSINSVGSLEVISSTMVKQSFIVSRNVGGNCADVPNGEFHNAGCLTTTTPTGTRNNQQAAWVRVIGTECE